MFEIKVIAACVISAALVYFVLAPFVEWIDRVKREMREENHYDD